MTDGLWLWFHESTEEAVRYKDAERLHLIDLHQRFWEHLEENPQYSLSLVEEGIELSKTLKDPCWELFHHYWRTELYLFYARQMDKALDSAIEGVVKAQKAAYQNCAVRGDVYRILVDSHTWIDPVGYEEKIRETITHMTEHMTLDTETGLVLIARQVQLAEALEDDKKALELAQMYLAKSEHYIFQRVHAWQYLCRIFYRMGDMKSVAVYAGLLELVCRQNHYRLELCVALAWLALVLRQRNEEAIAKRCYRQAEAYAANMQSIPTPDYFDALSHYHVAAGDIENAIALRERQIELLTGKHAIHHECEARLAYYKLLHQANKDTTQALTDAKQSARLLKKPERYLSRLQAIGAAP